MTIRNILLYREKRFCNPKWNFKIYYQIFVEIELRYPKTRWVVGL